jgi:integrase
VGRVATKPLTARKVETETRLGYCADSTIPGLYLQVTKGASGVTRSFIFRYTSPTLGKRREMGLGPVSVRKLADARNLALGYRAQLLDGIDPLDARQQQKVVNALARAQQMTFEQAATECIKVKSAEWKNLKHKQQWENTLTTYVYPTLGKVPMHLITIEAVFGVLNPIWLDKTETATRVRQRVEVVWDWAKARGYCTGENPARLKGALGELLPKAQKVKRVEHHAALPHQKVNAFVTALRAKKGVSALAFELMILTAARTSEVTQARWSEIDLATKVWTIPAERMKAGKEFRVPLSTRAMEILKVMNKGKVNEYVFFGHKATESSHLSNGAFLAVLKKMKGYEGITPHGFRSCFRDWASECTNFANETLELALAHVISNQTEASYRRQDQLPKRVKLMQSWAAFVDKSCLTVNVVSLKQRRPVGKQS